MSPPCEPPDLQAALKAIVDANRYMTLATADADGRPWASPVGYATTDYRELFWVSKPEARHSRNVAVRPELGIVIFDSTQPPGTGQGVYLSAMAKPVPEAELDRGLAVFSAVSEAQGKGAWGRTDVEPPARLRLYHALAAEHFVLSSRDERLRVELAGDSD
jgi:nitroimidazol reductase NimA-like FMN-containing flavoprotein (pyridoxamine 5'-phosphate oxidase superfamily)